MSEDIFGFLNLGAAIGMKWVEARGTAKHPKHGIAFSQQRVTWSKILTVPKIRNFVYTQVWKINGRGEKEWEKED